MNKIKHLILMMLVAAMMASCSSSKPTSGTSSKGKSVARTTTTTTKGSSSSGAKVGAVSKGQASYYADKFHGKATASGEKYDKKKLTAAHRTLPFGTVVRVTNKKNNKSVDVRINDRGPFSSGRIIDLSRAAAEKIAMVNDGVANVEVKIISLP